jgi:hypothetical protein
MPLDWEYITVGQLWEGGLDVGSAEVGEEAELLHTGAADRESSDDDKLLPRYVPASPGFAELSSSRVAELRASSHQRPLPQMLPTIRGGWLLLVAEARNRSSVPRREASLQEEGKSSFGSAPKASSGGWAGWA